MKYILNYREFINESIQINNLKESINNFVYFLLNENTSETRDYKRSMLKKVFGERCADLILLKLPITKFPIADVIAYLKHKIPIKSTIYDIVENNAGYINKDYLNSINYEDKTVEIEGTLDTLLKKVHYTVDICTTLDEAQKYKKYYKSEELICTYHSNNRFEESFVTFFVHDDIKNTKHANDLTQQNLNQVWKTYLTEKGRKNSDGTFNLDGLKPNQLDPYSKSLLSVQISKMGKTLKCISRYNHTIDNPDYVYNNLDNIIDGLHHKFYQFFNVNVPQGTKEDLPNGYVVNGKNQLFKYDKEYDGNYYGDGFVIKSDGDTIILDKNNDIMINGTLFNIKTLEYIDYYEPLYIGKITRIVPKPNNIYEITCDYESTIYNAKIKVVEGKLIEFESEDLINISSNFLCYNDTLTVINLPNVESIDSKFLYFNNTLTSITLPNVENIRNYVLYSNNTLTDINLPNVKNIGKYFLCYNDTLTDINLPKVQSIGSNFLHYNKNNTPSIKKYKRMAK